MYHAPHFLTLHLLFLKNNHSLRHFHFTVTKFRKVNPDVIIILNLSSVFQSHQLPQYVLQSIIFPLFSTEFSPGSCTAFHFHCSLVCVNLEQFLASLIKDNAILEKYRPITLQDLLGLGMNDVSSSLSHDSQLNATQTDDAVTFTEHPRSAGT